MGLRDTPLNLGGRVGAWFASVLLTLLGYSAYLLPLMIARAAGCSCASGAPTTASTST